MIDATLSLDAAEGLRGSDLLPYLARKGWSASESKIQGISILSKRLPGADRATEIILPIKGGFTDERRRVADAIRTLSQIEGSSEFKVADEIRETLSSSDADTIPFPIGSFAVAARNRTGASLSFYDIETVARILREELGIYEQTEFNIVELFNHQIPKVIDDFRLQTYTPERTNVEAYSRNFPPVIFARHDVYELASKGEPRSRFMLAHELGHVLLHQGASFKNKKIARFSRNTLRLQEEQASRFAAAFLMPLDLVINIHDPAVLSVRCKVSLEAAKFRMRLVYDARKSAMRSHGVLARVGDALISKIVKSFRILD